MGGLANFGGKRAAPFSSSGRKATSTKTATGLVKAPPNAISLAIAARKRKRKKPGAQGGVIDPDGIPNNGDEYRIVNGRKVPVSASGR